MDLKFCSTVWYHMYTQVEEILADFNLVVYRMGSIHQTDKFNSPPNLPATLYIMVTVLLSYQFFFRGAT